MFRLAAHKGFPRAYYNLGYCYRYGIGVDKNKTEATHFYKKAAEYGHLLEILKIKSKKK